jgi:hypothetical protein
VKDLLTFRANVLTSAGATTEEVDELLRYNENHFKLAGSHALDFPLADERFVKIWKGYAREVEQSGSLASLEKYLVQLRFPIQAGISTTPEYLACTRRGEAPAPSTVGSGFSWRDATRCRLEIQATAAGHIPCLIAELREDFVSLVQALARRNEPDHIPQSMGACLVAGYNNWDRIRTLRSHSGCTEETWPQEFQRIKLHKKELYQDCFIILGSGPYSGVDAAALGLEKARWSDLSLKIRREHECAHYFSRRVFASMRNNLLDELIADYFGISSAVGRFRADWLLAFFGLEAFPHYRREGRLEYYRREPRISDGAFRVLQRLLVNAARNLEEFDQQYVPTGQHLRMQPAIFMTLAALTMEQIAAGNGRQILADGLRDSCNRLGGQKSSNKIPRALADPRLRATTDRGKTVARKPRHRLRSAIKRTEEV